MEEVIVFERSAPADSDWGKELKREALHHRKPLKEIDGEVAVLNSRLLRQCLPAGAKPVGFNCLNLNNTPGPRWITWWSAGEVFLPEEVGEYLKKAML